MAGLASLQAAEEALSLSASDDVRGVAELAWSGASS